MHYNENKIAIIGGGYVGLNTAVHVAKKLEDGGKVIIIDINEDVVNRINSGETKNLHIKERYILENWEKVKEKIFATTEYAAIRDAGVIFVAVQTPLKDGQIDFKPLKMAGESISHVFDPVKLIISLTTIYPGGTEKYLAEPLYKMGYKVGKDFYLAHAPERINPGSEKWNVENTPRVVGAPDRESLKHAVEFLEKRLGLRIHPVSDIKVAEATKLLENTFRFINIAFVNELKKELEKKGINITEVIEAASTKPFGYMPFYPGPYIGGPCLPKDSKMLENFSNSILIKTAQYINEEQPYYYAEKLLQALKQNQGRNILFLGIGYKPGAYAAIHSPIIKVIHALEALLSQEHQEREIIIKKYDPNIPEESDFENLKDAIEWSDIIIEWGDVAKIQSNDKRKIVKIIDL